MIALAAIGGSTATAARPPSHRVRAELVDAATRFVHHDRCCAAIARIGMVAAEQSTVDGRFAVGAFDGWNGKNVEEGRVDMVFRHAPAGWRVISWGTVGVGCGLSARVRADLGVTCYTHH